MTLITAIGSTIEKFNTSPVLVQSTDGINWTNRNLPFNDYISLTSVTQNTNLLVITNSIGNIAVTSDLTNYSYNSISNFNPTNVKFAGNTYISTGISYMVNNSSVTQQATIYQTLNPLSTWSNRYIHATSPSYIYSVKYFQSLRLNSSTYSSCWIAVGYSDDNTGLILYSLDNGFSWTSITVPTAISVVYSCDVTGELSSTRIYFGTNIGVFFIEYLQDSNWDQILSSSEPVIEVVSSNTSVAFLTSSTVYSTQDNISITSWSTIGYNFKKITNFEENNQIKWLLFGYSTLTQYTYWISVDLRNWIPYNNSCHVIESSVI